MRFTLAFSFLFAGLAGPSFAQGESAPAAPEVEVMVLGTFHWANPGRDAVNMQVDDVLSPRRQREIAVLAQTLALWQPTRIAVERSEEHTSELQSLMRISYAVFCLTQKKRRENKDQ